MKEIEMEMRLERAKLDTFFRFCSIDMSFVELRKRMRTDKEVQGNGYWEVIRNLDGAGEVAQIVYIKAFSMRLLPVCEPVRISSKIKRTPITYDTIEINHRFRGFVQVFQKKKTFYKEFGDPRVMSADTGRYYETPEQLMREESEDGEHTPRIATEILHFAIHSPRSSYGVPRWIGALLAVLGGRQAEEINFLYFENKSVPPMVVMVNGGRLAGSSVKRIQDYIENQIKGKHNFHKILVLEGEGPSSASMTSNPGTGPKIEIKPLTQSQLKDGLFLDYDERSTDKVGMSFRLPRLLRGDIRDFNRATAEAALEYTENQVFNPEREEFDWLVNRKIFTDLGIKYWTFASNGPSTRNPMDLAEMVVNLVKASVLTPEEAREFARAIFNVDLKKIDEIWTKIPPELLKSGILPEGEFDDEVAGLLDPNEVEEPDLEEADDQGNEGVSKRYGSAVKSKKMRRVAKSLIALRKSLDAEELEANRATITEQAEEMEREVITIPQDEFDALLES
jgi:PBSX family phage portal protein